MSRAVRWQPGRGLRIVMLGFLVMTACLLVTTLALGQWNTADRWGGPGLAARPADPRPRLVRKVTFTASVPFLAPAYLVDRVSAPVGGGRGLSNAYRVLARKTSWRPRAAALTPVRPPRSGVPIPRL